MRRARTLLPGLIALAGCAGWPAAAHAQPSGTQRLQPAASGVAVALRDRARGAFKRFYAERGYRPLWAASGRIDGSAGTLIGFLASAELDGLKPSSYDVEDLREAVADAAGGNPEAVARAELALSAAFARYVRDQRRGGAEMIYADRRLKPKRPPVETVLRAAAFPKSFDRYVADMGWMSPHYVRLRRLAAEARRGAASRDELARLQRNLDRARLLPSAWTHHVVVDASSGRLWYYGAGKQAGTMRVVVGTPETPTPMLAGTLQWAIVNPYWNLPTYLARKTVAPKVLAGRSLASMRIEALSDWSESAVRVPASAIDWRAVATGDAEVRLRELPGAANSMGRVKFLFPNDEGIYLHDTPERGLLRKSDRHLSNGCIRLEHAEALGRWLVQRPIRSISKAPEHAVPLPAGVPVYLTYLTATATDRGLAFRRDVYGRDGEG